MRASASHTYLITRTAGATTRQFAAAGKAVRAAGGREGHERAFGALCHRHGRAVRTRLDRAKTEVDLALRLNPNLAIAHNLLGSIRMYSGQPLEAIPAIEQAMRLDPAFSHQFLHFLGTAYLFAGKYETAAALLRERIMLVPERIFPASRLPPRLATSVKSTRPAGYGPSSRRSTQSIRSANTWPAAAAGGGRRAPRRRARESRSVELTDCLVAVDGSPL